MTVLKSQLDHSVNFVVPCSDGGFFEARFVHRPETDYYIIYVSSFSGCNQACRMCHLTQTGQTMMTPATLQDFLEQVEIVAEYATEHFGQIDKVHVNFMARGEPLLNRTVTNDWCNLAELIHETICHVREDMGWGNGCEVSYRISTIFPAERANCNFPCEGMDVFAFFHQLELCDEDYMKPVIYWSLYSMDPDFRRKWLPKAMHPFRASNYMGILQDLGCKIYLHHALIEGENSAAADALYVAVHATALGADRVNLVMFNPPPGSKYQCASDDQYRRVAMVLEDQGMTVKIVPRVGFDVAASCGMFVTEEAGQ